MSSKSRRKPLNLERLDQRLPFNGDEISFVGYGSLTYSFAPDQTRIGNVTSDLFQHFDRIGTTDAWQEAIAWAIQTWSSQSNINIGLVNDSGDASGVYGPTRGDERFGDIRISGFEYALDSFAEAVSERNRSAGNWSGDIFFNTDAPWSSLDEIKGAALHEVGHALGLGHSTDPNSPMYEHGPTGKLQLTNQDILNLQSLHGVREPDSNESSRGNDTIDRATPIKGASNDETVLSGFQGNQVWLQFGDLLNASDKDVYQVKTSDTYSGPMGIEVRSKGLSLARLHVRVMDRDGNVITQGETEGDQSGISRLTIPATSISTRYFVEISTGLDPFWSIGDYSITIASPQVLDVQSEEIAQWARKAHRWYHDSDRTRDGFSFQLLTDTKVSPAYDDLHSDDQASRAQVMQLVLNEASRIVYRSVGTLSDTTDIDYFRLDIPKDLGTRSELTIDIESIDREKLVPKVSLVDSRDLDIPFETRVNGFGQTQLVVENVDSIDRIFIRLASIHVTDKFRIGSFVISATFSAPTTGPISLLQSSLDSSNQSSVREWYVARPQLFAFSLSGKTASTESGSTSDLVTFTLFDENKKWIAGLIAPLNEVRSAPGIFLEPGLYYLQITTTGIGSVQTELHVDQPSTPVGPLIGGTNVRPLYLCPGSTTEYCYPNTTSPTTVPSQVGPVLPSNSLPQPKPVAVAAADSWYWSNNFFPTNSNNPLDADGDNIVSPLDALIVINAINTLGLGAIPMPTQFVGYLDTNGNRDLDPLDVLQIINYLNSRPQ